MLTPRRITVDRYTGRMTDVTRILSQIEAGDPSASESLLPLVYDELRRLAAAYFQQERPGQTIQATALVHEAYVRLVDVKRVQHWNSRGHFFSAAAEAMRRILIDRARNKDRLKRGGGRQRVELESIEVALDTPAEDLLAVNEAMEQLSLHVSRLCRVGQIAILRGDDPG